MPPRGVADLGDQSTYRTKVLSHPAHKWEQRFRDGPLDFGFDSSFISMLGMQDPPYAFFEDDLLLTTTGLLCARSTCLCDAQSLSQPQATTEKNFGFGREEHTFIARGFPKFNIIIRAVARAYLI